MTPTRTEQFPDRYAAALDMVRRYLEEFGRQKRSTGRLTFEIDLKDGGVVEKWATLRRKET